MLFVLPISNFWVELRLTVGVVVISCDNNGFCMFLLLLLLLILICC